MHPGIWRKKEPTSSSFCSSLGLLALTVGGSQRQRSQYTLLAPQNKATGSLFETMMTDGN